MPEQGAPGVGFCFGVMIRKRFSKKRLWKVISSLEDSPFDSLWYFNNTGDMPPILDLLDETAANTTRLTIGPHVLVLPGRPVDEVGERLLALQLASRGRLIAGLGLGGGFDVLVPDARKAGAILEDAIPKYRSAWAAGVEGTGLDAPPIWLGGASNRTLERVAALADGWVPAFTSVSEFAQRRKRLDELVASAGRAPVDLAVQIFYVPHAARHQRQLARNLYHDVWRHRPDADPREIYVFGGHEELAERIVEFRKAGVNHPILIPAREPESWEDELDGLRAVIAETQ